MNRAMSSLLKQIENFPVAFIFFFLRFYLFIFRQRTGGRQRKTSVCERQHPLVASRALSTGDPGCNPGMCSDWELNR